MKSRSNSSKFFKLERKFEVIIPKNYADPNYLQKFLDKYYQDDEISFDDNYFSDETLDNFNELSLGLKLGLQYTCFIYSITDEDDEVEHFDLEELLRKKNGLGVGPKGLALAYDYIRKNKIRLRNPRLLSPYYLPTEQNDFSDWIEWGNHEGHTCAPCIQREGYGEDLSVDKFFFSFYCTECGLGEGDSIMFFKRVRKKKELASLHSGY